MSKKILYCLDCGEVLLPEEIKYPANNHFGGVCAKCQADTDKFRAEEERA